jgi:hypothetical protein
MILTQNCDRRAVLPLLKAHTMLVGPTPNPGVLFKAFLVKGLRLAGSSASVTVWVTENMRGTALPADTRLMHWQTTVGGKLQLNLTWCPG